MNRSFQKILVLLLLATFLLSACQPAVVLGSAPTPTGSVALQSYTSSLYGYTVRYPGNWGIKINTSVNTGPGTDPEYITLYPGDNMLPVLNIYALTGAAPLTGFETCAQNFDFQGLKACRISQPAGQVPASELLVFQKGNAHFLIGLQYEDPSSKEVFDQVLSLFEFVK